MGFEVLRFEVIDFEVLRFEVLGCQKNEVLCFEVLGFKNRGSRFPENGVVGFEVLRFPKTRS